MAPPLPLVMFFLMNEGLGEIYRMLGKRAWRFGYSRGYNVIVRIFFLFVSHSLFVSFSHFPLLHSVSVLLFLSFCACWSHLDTQVITIECGSLFTTLSPALRPQCWWNVDNKRLCVEPLRPTCRVVEHAHVSFRSNTENGTKPAPLIPCVCAQDKANLCGLKFCIGHSWLHFPWKWLGF
jgi:hypothetical protein